MLNPVVSIFQSCDGFVYSNREIIILNTKQEGLREYYLRQYLLNQQVRLLENTNSMHINFTEYKNNSLQWCCLPN